MTIKYNKHPFKPRHRKEIEFIAQNGSASVSQLAELLAVSVITIRRDLDFLEKFGVITRHFGGASINEEPSEPPLPSRIHSQADEKERIGQAVVDIVHGTESIILDAGSTTQMVANAFMRNPWKGTVLTIDPRIALTLNDGESLFSVLLTGGLLRKDADALVGTAAESFIRDFRVPYGVIGINGVDLPRGVMNSNVLDYAIKRAIIDASDHVIVVADSQKFQTKALAYLADWTSIDIVVTGRDIPETLLQTLSEHVRVITV